MGFIGTGIVTSVPSDSPDDYAALRDLKNKKVVALLLLLNVELRSCSAGLVSAGVGRVLEIE